METTVFEVKIEDGRIFRVFCANSTQKKRFGKALMENIKGLSTETKEITNGIHTVKQWEEITKSLFKNEHKNSHSAN